MSKKKGLGRGLGSLIAAAGNAEEAISLMVHVDEIKPNPHQPRSELSDQSLEELTESIKSHGVLEPIIICEAGNGFEIIAGERRWRAAKKAGLEYVPAILRRGVRDKKESLLLALVENLQRENLNPIEAAKGIQKLIETFGLTHESAAELLGWQRVSVTNALRLLKLPTSVQSAISSGLISAGHGRALLALPDAKAQDECLKLVIRNHWSVRQTEKWVRQYLKSPVPKKQKEPSPELNLIANRLTEVLGIRAKLRGTKDKGTITLEYTSREELESLIAQLSRLAEF